MTNKQAMEKLLSSGYTVEYRKLTICKINSYTYDHETMEYKYGWQVSDLKNVYSFMSLKKAIKKFMDLKERWYGTQRENSGVSKMPTTQRYPM